MGMAKQVDAPVILVADIDKGGVLASLYGTVETEYDKLAEAIRNNVDIAKIMILFIKNKKFDCKRGVYEMPLVKVEILKGKTPEFKKALLDGIHAALVEAFIIPDDDRMQRLYELDKENFEISSNKTENATIIELTVFKGRSYEAKKKLYAAIVNNLAASPGIVKSDILIVINEPPLKNWGVRGLPANEVDLGFKIDV